MNISIIGKAKRQRQRGKRIVWVGEINKIPCMILVFQTVLVTKSLHISLSRLKKYSHTKVVDRDKLSVSDH